MAFGFEARNAAGTVVIDSERSIFSLGTETWHGGTTYSLMANSHNTTYRQYSPHFSYDMQQRNLTNNYASESGTGFPVARHEANAIYRGTSTENQLFTSLPTGFVERVIHDKRIYTYTDDLGNSDGDANIDGFANVVRGSKSYNAATLRTDPPSLDPYNPGYSEGRIISLVDFPIGGELLYNSDRDYSINAKVPSNTGYPYQFNFLFYYVNPIAGWEHSENSVNYYGLKIRDMNKPSQTSDGYGLLLRDEIGLPTFNAFDEVTLVDSIGSIELARPPASHFTSANVGKYGWCESAEFGNGTSSLCGMELPLGWIFSHSTSSRFLAFAMGFILKRKANGKFVVITCYRMGLAKNNVTTGTKMEGGGSYTYPTPVIPYVLATTT